MHPRTSVLVLTVVIRFAYPSPVPTRLFNDNRPRTDLTATSRSGFKEKYDSPVITTNRYTGYAIPFNEESGDKVTSIQANPQIGSHDGAEANAEGCPGCDAWEEDGKAPKRTNLLILPLAATLVFIFCIIGRCIRWCHEDIELHDEKIEKEELEQADNISRRLSLSSRGDNSLAEPIFTEPVLQQARTRALSSRRNSTRSTHASTSSDIQTAAPPLERRFKRPPALGATVFQRDGSRSRRGSATRSESWGPSNNSNRVGSEGGMVSESLAVVETSLAVHDVSSPSSSLGYGSARGSAIEISQVFPGQPGSQQPMKKLASASDLHIARALLQLQGLSTSMMAGGSLLPHSTDSINSPLSQVTPTSTDIASSMDSNHKAVQKFPTLPHRKERQTDYTSRSMSISGSPGATKNQRYGLQDDPIELSFLHEGARSRIHSSQKLEIDCDIFDDASSAYSSYNSTEGQIFLSTLRSNQSLVSSGDPETHRRRTLSVDAAKIKQTSEFDHRRASSRKRGLLTHQSSLDAAVFDKSNVPPHRFHVTRLNSSMDSGVGDLSFSQFRFVKELPGKEMKEEATQMPSKQRGSLRRPGRVVKTSGPERWKARLGHPVMLDALHPNVVSCKTMKRIFSDPTLGHSSNRIVETHL